MNQSSMATDSIPSARILKKSESIRVSELERAIRINSFVRVLMDSIVIAVVLLAGQGAKTAFERMQHISEESISASRETNKSLQSIEKWIDDHRRAEEEMMGKAELFKRQMDKLKASE